MQSGLSENNPMRKELFVCLFEFCNDSECSSSQVTWPFSPTRPAAGFHQGCSSAQRPGFDPSINMGNFDCNPLKSFPWCKSNNRDQQQHLEKSTLHTKMVEPGFALAGRQITHRLALLYPQQINKYFLISHSSHLYTSGITPDRCCHKWDQCQGLGFRYLK